MSKTYSGSNKCCATCANWGGPRTLQHNTYSYVESINDTGKCYANAPVARTQGPYACEGSSCPKYQKWAALR